MAILSHGSTLVYEINRFARESGKPIAMESTADSHVGECLEFKKFPDEWEVGVLFANGVG